MNTVTIRELRNRGGEVVNRVQAGEFVTVTRGGTPVAEMRPVRRRGVDSKTLLERWRRLPPVDAAAFRADLDAILDPSL
jgi:prevent-host-death family protein